MIYEILDEQGGVVNRIEADQAFVDKHYPRRHRAVGNQQPVLVVVPQEVTRRQGLRALFLAGVTEAQVEAVLNQIEDETERGLALIDFRSAGTFVRTWPLVIQAGAVLGLDLDQLFITAATL